MDATNREGGRAIRKGAIVGRAAELVELERGLDEVLTGCGRLYVLTGEGGIGKTRLATEIGRRALERGFTVAWGRSAEAGGAPAFWPWTQILRALRRARARAFPSETINDATRPPTDSIERLLPKLSGGRPNADDPILVMNPDHARLALFEEVVEALRAVASPTAPLALLFEDLHAADSSSLALVHFLAQDLADFAVFVVVTCREQEARADAARSHIIERIAREGVRLSLRRFGAAEVRALLEQHAAVDSATVDRVLSTSEGNALFVEELARSLATGGGQELPSGIRDAIAQRLATLDPACIAVLGPASVSGREIDTSVVAALLGRSPESIASAFARAEAAGVLVALTPHTYAFSHPLVRDVLYRGLTRPRRTELHAKLADVLSAASDHAPAEIASHLLEALDAVGPDRAVRGSLDAARRAARMFAFDDAAGILTRAFDVVDATRIDPRGRAEALVLLGEAFMRTGEPGKGRIACVEAAAIARKLADPLLLADAALACGAEIAIARIDDTLIRLLREALDVVPEGELALRARVLARLAGAEQPAPDPRGPMARAREAIALARSSGDRFTLRMALQYAGSALVDFAAPEERAPLAREMHDLAVEAGDIPSAFRAKLRLFLDHLELGDRSAANACSEDLTRIAESLGSFAAGMRASATMTRACLAASRGGFPDALRLVDAACSGSGADAVVAATTEWALLFRIGLSFLRDQVEDVEPLAASLRDAWQQRVPVLAQWAALIIATARGRLGDLDGAKKAIAPFQRNDPGWTAEPAAVHLSGELVFLLKDAEWARELLPIARGLTSRFVSWGQQALIVFYPFDAIVGQLEATLGRSEEAFASFERAERRANEAGSLPAIAWTLYWHARARAEHGDIATADALARRARATCGEVRMDRLAERVDALAVPTKTGSPPLRETSASRPRPTAGFDFALRRDGEIWTITIGRGLTAKELRLKDSRGMGILARLVNEPGREMHVMFLGSDGADAGDLGSAGDVLDTPAIAKYRARIEDVRAGIDEAERFGDGGRAGKLREELDFLVREVAATVGVFGRSRKAAAVAERARVNVQRRVKDAIRRIGEQSPELGEYLGWTIRTGTFCSYRPPGLPRG